MTHAIGINDAVSGALGSTIDAEDAHSNVKASRLRERLQLLLVDVRVRIDVLDVIVLFERIEQLQ